MTDDTTVVLTRHERKDRLGHGGVKSVAAEVGVHFSLVSRVLNDKQRHAGVEDAIARRVVQQPNEIAFLPYVRTKRRTRTRNRAAVPQYLPRDAA